MPWSPKKQCNGQKERKRLTQKNEKCAKRTPRRDSIVIKIALCFQEKIMKTAKIPQGSSLDGPLTLQSERGASLDRQVEIDVEQHKLVIDNSCELTSKGKVHPSNVKVAHSKEEIIQFLGEGCFVKIDPLTYDISKEATGKIRFSFTRWFEDVFINLFAPFSYLYVYFKYGSTGMKNRHLFTGFKPIKWNPIEHDAHPAKVQMKAEMFFFTNVYHMVCKYVIVVCYVMGGYYKADDSHNSNRTHAPTYYVVLSATCFLSFLFLLGNKKALRCPESETRLLLQREKRNEELLNGWLPLPWWVAVFELRIAAVKAQLDLNSTIFFKGVTAHELSQAIGDKTLFYLKSTSSPLDFKFNEHNEHVKRFSACADLSQQEHVIDEMNIRGGSSCTVMALLLRGCLEQSYATPAFGEDATNSYGEHYHSNIWTSICWVVALSPIVCDYLLQQGNVKYDIYGILVCVFSLLILRFTFFMSPQGFIYGAILNIRRKARLQCFLNSVLDSDSDINHHRRWRSSWKYSMDFNDPSNFEVWGKCRSCIMRFGRRYQERTDSNAGMIIMFLGISTSFFIFYSAYATTRVPIRAIAYFVILYMFFVLTFASFAVFLALEGEACDEISFRTKAILSNALLKFESKIWKKNYDESLEKKQRQQQQQQLNLNLHNRNNSGGSPTKTSFDKSSPPSTSSGGTGTTMTSTITNSTSSVSSIGPRNRGSRLGGNLTEMIVSSNDDTTTTTMMMMVDYHAIRSAANQLHGLIDAGRALGGNKVLGMPLNKALIGSIIFLCFTQVTLIIDNMDMSGSATTSTSSSI
jgi:hypothetical protein